MLAFRYLVAVSGSAAIALGFGLSAVAQNQPPSTIPISTSTLNKTTEVSEPLYLEDEITSPPGRTIPLSAPPVSSTPSAASGPTQRQFGSIAPSPLTPDGPESTANQPPNHRQAILTPDNLNPSINPLLFPTQGEEVTIDINQPITLEQAIQLARRNNQQLQEARLDLDKAQTGLREVWASVYPSVEANATVSRTDSSQSDIGNAIARNNPLSTRSENYTITDAVKASLEVSYNLYDGGRRPAQIREAERQVRLAQLDIERRWEQLRLDVANAYYALQEADATVDIEQGSVNAARQTLRDAQLLEKAGIGTRFDVLRAEVSLANSSQSLARAQSQQQINRRKLGQVLSLGEKVEVTIADPINPAGEWNVSLQETIVIAYKNRAELEQQLVQREIGEQRREIAISALRPQVNLFATYDVVGVLDDGVGPGDGYSLGAQVQWKLFDGGQARARRESSTIDTEIAEVNFERQRNQIRVEVEEAFYTLETNKNNIKTAAGAVQLAEESLKLARLRFNAGVGTQTDVIDAQTELTRAKGSLLTAIINYNRAFVALQRAVSNVPDGRLFDLP